MLASVVFATLQATLISAEAPASGVQVALWVDLDAPKALLDELAALEKGLGGADLALAYAAEVEGACAPKIAKDFGQGLEDVAGTMRAISAEVRVDRWRPRECLGQVEVLEALADQLAWREGTTKRIVVAGRWTSRLVKNGRSTIEEVVHRFERRDLVLHALGYEQATVVTSLDGAPASADLRAFLLRPTAPMGRPSSDTRHATVLSGGTTHVVVDARDLWKEEDRETQRRAASVFWGASRYSAGSHAKKVRAELLTPTYGPRDAAGRDALDALAEGHLRPSEPKPEDLPAALAGVRLEPLLDTIWDLVDARRTVEEVVTQVEDLAAKKPWTPGTIGARLARDVLAPRRIAPSRR